MGLFSKKKMHSQEAKTAAQDQLDFQAVFAKNLKYISQTEINAAEVARQFVKSQTRYHLTVGQVDCPSGKIVVSDPLDYLPTGELCPQLSLEIPTGT